MNFLSGKATATGVTLNALEKPVLLAAEARDQAVARLIGVSLDGEGA